MASGPYERFYPGEARGLVDPTWGGGAHRLSAPSVSKHGGTIGLLTAGAGAALGGYRLGLLGHQAVTKAGEALDRIMPIIGKSVPLWIDSVMSNLPGGKQRERLKASAVKLGVDPNMVLERSSDVVDFPGGLLEDFGPGSSYERWREDPDTAGDMMEIYEEISTARTGIPWKFSEKDADFYILKKGENAGRIEKEAGPNTIGVVVDREVLDPSYAKYMFEHVGNTGVFKKYLKGTAVQYITHDDIDSAVIEAMQNTLRGVD